MSYRKRLAAALATGVVGLGVLGAAPAVAAGGCSSNCAATTNVTFDLGSSSGLSISVPSNNDVDLGDATSNVLGTSVAGALRSTTVTDTRGSLLAAWTVTVSNTAFTGSGTAAGETLPANKASMYIDGVTTLANVVGLAAGGLIPTSAALSVAPVASGGTLLAGTTTGSGNITYTPGVSISIPAATVAGTYAGSVTQTVS